MGCGLVGGEDGGEHGDSDVYMAQLQAVFGPLDAEDGDSFAAEDPYTCPSSPVGLPKTCGSPRNGQETPVEKRISLQLLGVVNCVFPQSM